MIIGKLSEKYNVTNPLHLIRYNILRNIPYVTTTMLRDNFKSS